MSTVVDLVNGVDMHPSTWHRVEMTKSMPPPIRPAYSKKLRAMRKGASLFFLGARPDSIKAIASRVGVAESRSFITRKEVNGVYVWRLS